MMTSAPVGWPGLAAMAAGFVAFQTAFFLARSNRDRGDAATGQRAPRSWIGIVVQGLGIGVAALGPIAIRLDAVSPLALTEAALVAALMAAVAGLFAWSARTMGRNWSLEARTRADHSLVTTGPFAFVRHPIYVALFLFMLAFAVAFGHLAHLWLAMPLFALGTWLRIREEEALLARAFGPAYSDYAARVKRFVPGIF